MSLFDLPRINVKGTLSVNPATANNDDYAGSFNLPDNWGPFAGDTLALIDSKLVEARTYGMSDANFIAWVQQPHTFNNTPPPGTMQIVPAEWNYYGDLTMKATGSVVGVQGGPASLIGASFTFSGGMCDVNSQGSPPATQFFIDQLTLTSGGKVVIQGQPSKGACQWINFYRNVNRTSDGGAGGYFYHVLLKATPGTILELPELQDPKIAGVILRYYVFNIQFSQSTPPPQPNPATLELIATLAPFYADDEILTGPTGRLLLSNSTPIATPTTNNNGKGNVALAPAVLRQRGNSISADFSGTFPENYHDATSNPKFDFGPVTLVAVSGLAAAPIGPVHYAHAEAGNERGWIYDFDISANAGAQAVLANADATFRLVSDKFGIVLDEADYYFVSNQQAIYSEQYGPADRFLNQGSVEPAAVGVYHRGRRLDAATCPPITVWQYRSIPLQAPGDAEVNAVNVRPGDPISVDTAQPGNYLLTFTINDAANPAPAGYPPKSYTVFQNPPWVTNAPSISLRILPNNEDFSRYYADPTEEEAVGNELLTFDVVYRKVLRTYYLLYPAMNKLFPLNDEKAVAKAAQAILDRTEMSLWMTTSYMPRTRDMSESRRRLLRAWCRRVLKEAARPAASSPPPARRRSLLRGARRRR